ncbi:hypothetical protein POM88_037867 [Heracleum sosnowskyi]|uniref:Sieve element occlusion C-terminal domain-containing protein n=1 Tax=Heracleum sosnowskyi TaxID=360622 RepID=A0AAD8MDN9_9APIA|nr:hypothetical protein POM88_037867 [Heracleum sosnowskyi]
MAQISNEILGGKNPAASSVDLVFLRWISAPLIRASVDLGFFRKALTTAGLYCGIGNVAASNLRFILVIITMSSKLSSCLSRMTESLSPVLLMDIFLIPEIENALCDTSSTTDLKLEALILTRLVLDSNSPTVLYPYIESFPFLPFAARVTFIELRVSKILLSRPAISAVRDSFYKVTAEALRVCGEIVCVVRPNTEGCNFNFEPYVYPIYNAIMERLTNQDQDQEVKKCAISCMGLVLSTFGDNLGAELPACLTILANRMGNEITRLAAVMIIWGSKAFPFSTSKEKELWKEQNWSLKFLLDCVDPLLLKWVDEGRNFCLYGSDDLYWTREFNSRMDEIRNAGLNFQESTLIGIFEESLLL